MKAGYSPENPLRYPAAWNASESFLFLEYKRHVKTSKKEGCTGVPVFLRCTSSWFCFLWNMNLGNRSSWFVTWRFCMACEDIELLTNICDFTTVFCMITLRLKSFEWLESSIESDLDMRFAIRSLAFCNFAFFSNLFCCKNWLHVLKRISYMYLLSLLWFEKTKFLYPWSVILYFFCSWTMPEIPYTTLKFNSSLCPRFSCISCTFRGHLLKPETTKRNHQKEWSNWNKTTETSKTTKTSKIESK